MKARRERGNNKVRGALRDCGYPEWALTEGGQRGEQKLRKEDDAQDQRVLDQGEGKSNTCTQFAMLTYFKGVTECL